MAPRMVLQQRRLHADEEGQGELTPLQQESDEQKQRQTRMRAEWLMGIVVRIHEFEDANPEFGDGAGSEWLEEESAWWC